MTRLFRAVAAAAACVLAVAISVVVPSMPAVAEVADGANFSPGMIITDALFYDGTSMTAQEVQAFLEQRGASCVAGELPCLKDYRTTTRTWVADSYCSGYDAGEQTAAQIISGVGASCGVSPKALLVLLQKEQSLVTRTRPTARAYEIATGYGCPDTAQCNSEYYGFFNQVYRAARQYKVYQANPTRYGYQAGRSNFISWHPDRNCGGSQVFIENQATAGLYIYTPHQPNAAALRDVYSNVGDACSSWGNRNFWRFYTDWFGSTRGYPVSGGIASVWNSRGGLSGPGAATGPEISEPANGGGWHQSFRNGTISWTTGNVGTFLRSGTAITGAWERNGAHAGTWGWPLTDETCSNGTCQITFQNVTATWTATTGVVATVRHSHPVSGGIASVWNSRGGLSGPGAATGPEISEPANGGGWHQSFRNGTISWTTGNVGTFLRSGTAITGAWERNGAHAGTWGWPLTDETCSNGTCQITFQNVTATWTATTGVVATVRHSHPVSGGIASVWNSRGGLSGPGAATGPEISEPANGGGWHQSFRNGTISWTTGNVGTFLRSGTAITGAWERNGAHAGTWGWPLTDETCSNGTCQITFQNVTATWTATTGVVATVRHSHPVSGGIASVWNSRGGLSGPGAATGPEISEPANGGGWHQSFRNGTISWTTGNVGTFLRSGTAITGAWERNGAHAGTWGWPLTDETCSNGTCQITFQNVTATWTATTGVVATVRHSHPVSGGIASVWNSRGGLSGPGAATGPEISEPANGGGWHQSFRNGTISWTTGNVGTFLRSGTAITGAWERNGAHAGTWGLALTDETCSNGTCQITFQNVTATWTATTGVVIN